MSFMVDVRESYAQLASAQKPGAGVPHYMRFVNRRLGRMIAAMAKKLGATPDQMTAASALLFVAGMSLLVWFPPSAVLAIVVTMLLQLAFAFDSADGQLARLTGTGSAAGEWLDHVVDAARILLLHLGVAVCLLRHTDFGTAWLLLPLGFAFVASLRFFALMLADQLMTSPTPAVGPRAWVQTPADPGVVNAVFLLWPWTPVFLVGYAVLGTGNLLLLLATLHRRHRALREGSAP